MEKNKGIDQNQMQRPANPSNRPSDNAQPSKKGIGDLLIRIILTPEIGMLIPIVLLCVYTNSVAPKFMTWKYQSNILRESIFIGAAALGQAFACIAGEIDLSVGMSGCLSGIMMGVACQHWQLGLVPCLLVALGTGIAVGLINGLATTRLGLSSWITTLATQFICRGLVQTISQGNVLSIKELGTSTFKRARPLWDLSWMFFIFILLILICDLVIRRTRFGYRVRGCGGNPNAAVMAGINVKNIKLVALVLAGFFAAVGGVFDVISNGSAVQTFGDGREFRTIICVNIGGIAAGSIAPLFVTMS